MAKRPSPAQMAARRQFAAAAKNPASKVGKNAARKSSAAKKKS